MGRRRLGIGVMVALMLCGASATAAGQDGPVPEFTGGYMGHGHDDEGLYSGWFTSVTVTSRRFGFVVEAGRVARRETYTRRYTVSRAGEESFSGETRVRSEFSVLTYGIGIRYRASTGTIRPFGQFVVGSADLGRQDPPPHSSARSSRLLTFSPSVGVDAFVWPRVGLRFQVDWLTGFNFDGEGFRDPRFKAGLTYGFGSR